jgi:hypothetical protein
VAGADSEQVENDARNVMVRSLSLEANRLFSISWRDFSGTIAPDACHHFPTVSFPMNDIRKLTFRGRNTAYLQRLFPQQSLLRMARKTRLSQEKEPVTNSRFYPTSRSPSPLATAQLIASLRQKLATQSLELENRLSGFCPSALESPGADELFNHFKTTLQPFLVRSHANSLYRSNV